MNARLLLALSLFILASCATMPPIQGPPEADDPPVMGNHPVPLDRFLAFVMPRNPALGQARWTEVWTAYRDACQTEGVNQTLALVQMLHETNWLRFGGDVQLQQNNFAGLGVTGGGRAGLSFPDIPTGALAHVQHLKAYGSTAPLHAGTVDPRFRYVKRGTAPTMRSLTGHWAMDPHYGEKLWSLYRQLASPA